MASFHNTCISLYRKQISQNGFTQYFFMDRGQNRYFLLLLSSQFLAEVSHENQVNLQRSSQRMENTQTLLQI